MTHSQCLDHNMIRQSDVPLSAPETGFVPEVDSLSFCTFGCQRYVSFLCLTVYTRLVLGRIGWEHITSSFRSFSSTTTLFFLYTVTMTTRLPPGVCGHVSSTTAPRTVTTLLLKFLLSLLSL